MAEKPMNLAGLTSEERRGFRHKYHVFFFDKDAFVAMSRSSIDLRRMSVEDRRNFRDKYQAFFFDMDGTLIKLFNSLLPGAAETVSTLSSLNKEIYVLTDSCMMRREAVSTGLRRKLPQIKQDHVINTSWLISHHLKSFGFDKKIYVIGQDEGIVKELTESGFKLAADEQEDRMELGELAVLELDPEVGAVVVGTDLNFTYRKLFKAVNYLLDPSVIFLTSSRVMVGAVHPLVPGVGALTSAIESVTGRTATDFGKNSQISIELTRKLGVDMERCLFIGDGLEYDISHGNMCGMDTLLVLTGVTDLDDLEAARRRGDHTRIPSYVAESLQVLADVYN